MMSEEDIRSFRAREAELSNLWAVEYARFILSGDDDSASKALLRFAKHDGVVKILSEVLK